MRQTPHFTPTNVNQKIDVSSPIGVNHFHPSSNHSNSYGNHFHFDKPPTHNGHSSQNSKGSTAVILEETCPYYIGQCVNIERIIFIMKYYRFWREYKQQQYQSMYNNNNNGYNMSQSPKFPSV